MTKPDDMPYMVHECDLFAYLMRMQQRGRSLPREITIEFYYQPQITRMVWNTHERTIVTRVAQVDDPRKVWRYQIEVAP